MPAGVVKLQIKLPEEQERFRRNVGADQFRRGDGGARRGEVSLTTRLTAYSARVRKLSGIFEFVSDVLFIYSVWSDPTTDELRGEFVAS